MHTAVRAKILAQYRVNRITLDSDQSGCSIEVDHPRCFWSSQLRSIPKKHKRWCNGLLDQFISHWMIKYRGGFIIRWCFIDRHFVDWLHVCEMHRVKTKVVQTCPGTKSCKDLPLPNRLLCSNALTCVRHSSINMPLCQRYWSKTHDKNLSLSFNRWPVSHRFACFWVRSQHHKNAEIGYVINYPM